MFFAACRCLQTVLVKRFTESFWAGWFDSGFEQLHIAPTLNHFNAFEPLLAMSPQCWSNLRGRLGAPLGSEIHSARLGCTWMKRLMSGKCTVHSHQNTTCQMLPASIVPGLSQNTELLLGSTAWNDCHKGTTKTIHIYIYAIILLYKYEHLYIYIQMLLKNCKPIYFNKYIFLYFPYKQIYIYIYIYLFIFIVHHHIYIYMYIFYLYIEFDIYIYT